MTMHTDWAEKYGGKPCARCGKPMPATYEDLCRAYMAGKTGDCAFCGGCACYLLDGTWHKCADHGAAA